MSSSLQMQKVSLHDQNHVIKINPKEWTHELKFGPQRNQAFSTMDNNYLRPIVTPQDFYKHRDNRDIVDFSPNLNSGNTSISGVTQTQIIAPKL